jgi:hypothetical protein
VVPYELSFPIVFFRWITNGESVAHPLPLLPGQAVQCLSESAAQLCIGDRTGGGQLSIEPIYFSLFPTQLLVLGSELLLHLIQPPTQGGNHLVFCFVSSTLWRSKPMSLFCFLNSLKQIWMATADLVIGCFSSFSS